jgi:FAD/FMN-containing dehydrogenase
MTDATTIRGLAISGDGDGLEAFAAGLHGRVIGPDAPDYDEARAIWSGMIDRRPAVIVRCAETADIIRAVRFAREHDLLVAVRGGGHNVAGTACATAES